MIDESDKKLLNKVQKGLTIEERPFHSLGEELGLSSDDVIQRLQKLKENGYIRRIGGVFDSAAMGLKVTLIAAGVSPDSFYTVAQHVSAYTGVTHCYRRDDEELNLWFTFIYRKPSEKEKLLQEIQEVASINRLYELPKIQTFKLNVFFNMGNNTNEGSR